MFRILSSRNGVACVMAMLWLAIGLMEVQRVCSLVGARPVQGEIGYAVFDDTAGCWAVVGRDEKHAGYLL